MSNDALILRRRWGSFIAMPEVEYSTGHRTLTTKGSIESSSGTVLMKATANVDHDDVERIVRLLNAAIERAA